MNKKEPADLARAQKDLFFSALSITSGLLVWMISLLAATQATRVVLPQSFDEAGFTTDVIALLLLLALGAISSILSGWITATIAPRLPIVHGLMLGICLLVVSLSLQFTAVKNNVPPWFTWLFLLHLIPATLLGTRFRRASSGPK